MIHGVVGVGVQSVLVLVVLTLAVPGQGGWEMHTVQWAEHSMGWTQPPALTFRTAGLLLLLLLLAQQLGGIHLRGHNLGHAACAGYAWCQQGQQRCQPQVAHLQCSAWTEGERQFVDMHQNHLPCRTLDDVMQSREIRRGDGSCSAAFRC
jgi:hypothetical protein